MATKTIAYALASEMHSQQPGGLGNPVRQAANHCDNGVQRQGDVPSTTVLGSSRLWRVTTTFTHRLVHMPPTEHLIVGNRDLQNCVITAHLLVAVRDYGVSGVSL